MKIFTVSAICLLASGLAFGQATTAPRDVAPFESVSVTGTGRVSVAPDRVTFTVGVETAATTVDDAVKQNSTRSTAVVNALKAAGARPEEIRTSNFSIYPQQDYQQGQRPRIVGYQVNNSVTVTKNNPAEASKLLQAAINAGVNTASGLSFIVSDPARGRDEGLRNAFNDARAKASTLAAASGRTLGRAISIAEGSGTVNVPPMPMARTMAMEAKVAPDVPVEAGENELTFTVTVVFELR